MKDGIVLQKELLIYKNINIIFDEIELYAHPEFQRSFIKDLLKAIYTISFSDQNLNIIFITHSPFILSDIPKQNVLFLEEGIPQDFNRMNTFGANITDLLADSFFFSEEKRVTLIGDFAKDKINEVIEWLNSDERDKNKKDDYKKIIEMIDEPLISNKLLDMYYEIFPLEYDLEQEKEQVRKKAIEFGLIKE
ncbi:MAG: hypothetical protein DCF13_13500 [Flavobacteriaceae bacterium]|nr:MAG: hypothetical protein DCF13_13500 [Flavobacteriaceae bacterium]